MVSLIQSNFSLCGVGIAVEGRVPAAVLEGLAKLGHQVERLGDFSEGVGGGQAVMRDDKAGVNYGASDPRKDGQAIAEMPGMR
jgi:gamma-glutamyltranspeptidase/glutathione hydrolase